MKTVRNNDDNTIITLVKAISYDNPALYKTCIFICHNEKQINRREDIVNELIHQNWFVTTMNLTIKQLNDMMCCLLEAVEDL